MPKKGSHVVIIAPDMHFPFVDQNALACLKKAIRYLKPRRFVQLGDLLNGTPFSRHAEQSLKEAAVKDFKKFEVDPANKFLDFIDKHVPGECAITAGNHDMWAERAAAQNKELQAVYPLISPEHLLLTHRKKGKWQWIKYGRDVAIPGYHYEITPNYWAFHGWSIAKNFAQAHLRELPTVSSICGHTHRSQSIERRLFDGTYVKSHSPGTLSELSPRYMGSKPSGWTHGFTVAYVKNDLSGFTSYDVVIESDGSCILPCGRHIR